MSRKNTRHRQIPLTSHGDELPEPLRERLQNAWSETFYRECFLWSGRTTLRRLLCGPAFPSQRAGACSGRPGVSEESVDDEVEICDQ